MRKKTIKKGAGKMGKITAIILIKYAVLDCVNIVTVNLNRSILTPLNGRNTEKIGAEITISTPIQIQKSIYYDTKSLMLFIRQTTAGTLEYILL